MVDIGDITKYLDPLKPFFQYIVLFVTPIYWAIGEFFAKLGVAFVGIFPEGSLIWAYIVAIVLAVLGIVLGIKTDPERQ